MAEWTGDNSGIHRRLACEQPGLQDVTADETPAARRLTAHADGKLTLSSAAALDGRQNVHHMRASLEMPEYLFPEVERVVYGRAPLADVICQVRFPADLRIETTPPADFQQRIRAQFPLLVQHHRATLGEIPAQLAEALQAVLPPPGNTTTWQFSTEDGTHALQLAKDSLTLVSRSYPCWERFHEMFAAPLAALQQLYQPAFFTRVGLRYRDIIQRSKLDLSQVTWSALLKPHILAEMGQNGFEARTEVAHRNVLLKLPDGEAKVRLQHGLAELEGSTEQVYLIDCDFFVERTEAANGSVKNALQYFHGNAARFFRWCITDQLHQAMDPQPPA